MDNIPAMSTAEAENIYLRYAHTSESFTQVQSETQAVCAYKPNHRMLNSSRITRQLFDLDKVKRAAQVYNVSLNVYLSAHIIEAINLDRCTSSSDKPIVLAIAVDCRKLLSSSTLRNCVAGATFSIDTITTFERTIALLQQEKQKMSTTYFESVLSDLQASANACEGLPITEQKVMFAAIHESNKHAATAVFSNLGMVTLPDAIAARVSHLDFCISQDGNPYTFAAISLHNVLTLTITSNNAAMSLENAIYDRIQADIAQEW